MDFEINAMSTLYLLEAARKYCPESPFVFLSTNKVYGDNPNRNVGRETETRFDGEPVNETMSVDQCMHSLFGVSKLSADLMVQEYGKYFGMKTCCLRCGCLTGPAHRGVELHGFLSYLIKCNVLGIPYTVYGHKGKQVRDNLHALDVARFIHEFIKAPGSGEVYNLGGGRENSISINEALSMVQGLTGNPSQLRYVEEARKGDHICYISDLSKCQSHYPEWRVRIGLPEIFEQIVAAWTS
jgi:CDP-paratose 2-epimerase